MMKKQQPWEESVGIPLIARWPGRIPAGRTSDALATTVAFAPTLLGLAGLTTPGGLQGTDRSPLLRGEGSGGANSAFITDPVSVDESRTQGSPEWRGVRTRRHTYARLRDGAGSLLYDGERDSLQLKNPVAAPEHAAARRLRDAEPDGWRDRVGGGVPRGVRAPARTRAGGSLECARALPGSTRPRPAGSRGVTPRGAAPRCYSVRCIHRAPRFGEGGER
jgi:arylsulfatase A-like enzyme